MEKVIEINHITSENSDEFEDESVFDDLPEDLKSFWKSNFKGSFEPLNYDVTTDDKPEWLDVEKFKRGQKFALDNFSSLSYAVIHALLMMFTDHIGRNTFIFAKSFIPAVKAHKQILTIATAVRSWIKNDIWSDANSAARVRMRKANKMHQHYYREFLSASPEKMTERTTLNDINRDDLNLHKAVVEDFKTCFPSTSLYSKYRSRNTNVTVTQAAASFTLFGLAGLVVTYPKYYGFQHSSEEDLEAYAHMWRALGYLLGVRDEYNILGADLNTIRSRTKSIIELWIRPAFRQLDENWEYLAKSFVEGSLLLVPANGISSFNSTVLDLINFLGVDYRSTKKYVSFFDYFRFLSLRFCIFLTRVPGVRTLTNFLVNLCLKRAEKNFAFPRK